MSSSRWRPSHRGAGFHKVRRRSAARRRPLRLESLEDRRLLSATRLDPEILTGDVLDQYEVSPDGQFGVYAADADVDDHPDLFSVEFSTGEIRKLTGNPIPGGVTEIRFTPDSTRAVYRTWERGERWTSEIYSVPLRGGESTKLTGPLPPGGPGGGDAREFVISPDGTRVIFRSDQARDEVDELFSISVTGGVTTKLTNFRPDHQVRPGFDLSADGLQVVYRAGQARTESLYSVAVTGGDSTKLADTVPDPSAADDADTVKITPDDSRVIYLSDTELFSVPLTGGSPVRLSGEVEPGFRISRDSEHVIFVADGNLFRAPAGGGDLAQLNPTVEFATVQPDVQISPDGRHVVYRADQESNFVFELYSVPIAGGPSIKLNNTPVAGGDVAVHDGEESPVFQITPDSQRVVYFADEQVDGDVELFSAPLAGGGSTKLSHVSFPVEWYTSDFRRPDQRYPQVSPDSGHVVYAADRELFTVPITGGNPTVLNGPLAQGGEVSGFRVARDGDRVLYRANQDAPGVWELYSAPTSGGGTAKHSGPLLATGHTSIGSARITPDGQFALYRSVLEAGQQAELYRVDIASGATTRLSTGGPDGGSADYKISQDERWIVYRTTDSIYRLPIDGTDPVRLHELPEGRRLEGGMQLTSDSLRVVYTARRSPANTIEFYSVPISGSPPTKLTEIADVEDWRLSADNQWVVISNRFGVFSVPINGGSLNQLLNVRVPRFQPMEISPDSSRVVFWGDFETERINELFSVPIEGGDVVRLNGPLSERGDVFREFAFSPDGLRVVYLANQDDVNVVELYSVSIAGGEPTKLNDELIERLVPLSVQTTSGDLSVNWGSSEFDGGDVLAFQVSPDGRHIVYLADQETDQQPELFSVPVGGGNSTKLNMPLAEGSRVLEPFALSPDGRSVVFLTGEDEDEPADMFHVPVDGGDPTRLDESFILFTERDEPSFVFSGSRLLYRSKDHHATVVALHSAGLDGSGTTKLSDSGRVSEFDISDNGRQVVYRHDADRHNQFELFSVPITGGRAERLTSRFEPYQGVTQNFRDNLGFAITPDGGHVVYVADEEVRRQYGLYAVELPEQPDLLVTSFAADSTGFTLDFNSELDEGRLNLYDAESIGLGAADIVVEGAMTGVVTGSLVLNDARNSARFIKSGDVFAPDTYTVRLRSGFDGVQSTNRYLLNGDASGLAGDDFLASFSVIAAARVVSLPDFVRGPGQAVGLPNAEADGIPLSISDGAGVRGVSIRVEYDPALLSITDAILGPNVPTGAAVALDASTPGTAVLSFTSPTELSTGEQVLMYLQGIIPESAGNDSYGRHQIVRLESVSVVDAAGGSLPSVPDHGLQVISLFGDVSLNGRINAFDASSLARVAAGIDTGFPANRFVDPVVIADVTGNGVVNASDALRLYATSVGLDPSDLPGPIREDPPEPPPPPDPPPGPQPGATTRLDNPRAMSGDVIDFELSPDGEFAVYVADSTIDDVFDLYSVDLSSGAVRKLSAANDEGSLLDFRFSPDGQRVVYRTIDREELVNLYSASLRDDSGGQLNGMLADGSQVGPLNRFTDHLFSPNGEVVIYMTDRSRDDPIELFSVPVAGGTSTQLVGTLLDGGSLWEFELNVGDGYRLLARDRNWRGAAELNFVDPAGQGPVDSANFKTSPDGAWEVFVNEGDGNLYSKPRGGGPVTKLNGQLSDHRDEVEDFLISPNSQFVFYVAEQLHVRHLYRVPIAGGNFTQLSRERVSTGIRISPDGSRIVFLQDSELVSASTLGGGTIVTLSGDLDPIWNRFQISPDSQWVVFQAQRGRYPHPDATSGIYTVPLTGTGAAIAVTTTPSTSGIGKFTFSPDGSRVIYVAEREFEGSLELSMAPLNGADSTRLSVPHASLGGTVTDIRLSQDGQFLVYRADHDVDDLFELYAVSTVTGGMVKLSGPFDERNVEPDFRITADGERVIYRANERIQSGTNFYVFRSNLFSVRLTGGDSTRLNRPIIADEIDDFDLSPDGSLVVFRSGLGVFSVSSQGGPITRLNVPGNATHLQISADNNYVVYRVRDPHRIFSAPLNGGEPTELNGPLGIGDNVLHFELSADGSRVVYAVRERNDNVALYSVLTSGGELVKLNQTDTVESDFQITADSQRVLYRGRQIGLFSVSITGGQPMRISNPVQGQVQPFPLLSPDGERVFYLVTDRAQQVSDDTSKITGDLYSVPITGGEPTAHIDLERKVRFGYQLSADGQSIVYRGNQDSDGVIELYTMPISGGGSVKLNDPLTAGGDVSEFIVLPIYNGVVYLADQDIDGQVGIYRTRID